MQVKVREFISGIFYSAYRRDYLKGRAGSEHAGEEAVQIYRLVFPCGVAVDIGGLVIRVIGRSRDHAENLPRLVVIYAHRALSAVQGVIRRDAEVGVYSQGYVVARSVSLQVVYAV